MTLKPDRRTLLAAGLALAAHPAIAAETPATVRVTMKTGLGVILIDLNLARAPITAGNFLRYVDGHRYDGESFFRASNVKGAPGMGLIEGGVRSSAAKVFKPIAHESTAKTGLTHKDGAISLARNAPGTATSDFFICIGDMTNLDADFTKPGDNQGFAVFGQVADGMDVVKAILAAHTSPTAGIGPMKGEILSPPIPIVSVRRAKADAAA
jgi:peptidyl-prolyl cis-trans isomerase A (cyclophilin A)